MMEAPVVNRESPGMDLIARSILGTLIVLGSLFLWIGIPIGGLWVAGEITTTGEGFLFAALGGIPLAMAGMGWLLYRLNGLYESFHPEERRAPGGQSPWLVSATDERSRFRRARGPRPLIEIAMTISAVSALVLLVVWFFFVAEYPLVTPL